MTKEQLKSMIIFLVLLAVTAYVAHAFAVESEKKFETIESQSTTFLDLIDRLNNVEFDLEFVRSFTGSGSTARTRTEPGAVARGPENQVGRVNPFSDTIEPLTQQSSFTNSSLNENQGAAVRNFESAFLSAVEDLTTQTEREAEAEAEDETETETEVETEADQSPPQQQAQTLTL